MPRQTLESLKEQRDAVNARIRRAEAKLRGQERRNDTRRKVLAGAAVIERAARDEAFRRELHDMLGRFLQRADDRQLFGFPTLVQDAGQVSDTSATQIRAA